MKSENELYETEIRIGSSCHVCGERMAGFSSWGNICTSCNTARLLKRELEKAGIGPDSNLKECYIGEKTYNPEDLKARNRAIMEAPEVIDSLQEKIPQLKNKCKEAREEFDEAVPPYFHRYNEDYELTFGISSGYETYPETLPAEEIQKMLNVDKKEIKRAFELERKKEKICGKLGAVENKIRKQEELAEKKVLKSNVTDEMVHDIRNEIHWEEGYYR